MKNNLSTKICFIGGGPANLLAAAILWRQGFSDFLILEKGNSINKRNHHDKNSLLCPIMHGVGGAGLFSDGKINIHPKIGGEPLNLISDNSYKEYCQTLIETLAPKKRITDEKKITAFNESFPNSHFLNIEQYHLGTNNLKATIKNLIDGFEGKVLSGFNVETVIHTKKQFLITNDKGDQIYAESVVIATGQNGSNFASSIARDFGVKVDSTTADVGVRLETEAKVLKPIIDLQYDPKIYFTNNNHTVRTFCTNPGGDVVIEKKNEYLSVNGHSDINNSKPLSNTALMCNIKTTSPKKYTIDLCKKIYSQNKEQIGVQDISELIDTEKAGFTVRLPHTVSCIADFYEETVTKSIVSTLSQLNDILKGRLRGYIYFPEVKLYNEKISVKKDSFESEGIVNSLYFLGDCTGTIHGLTNACLSGISFARQYLG